MCPNTVLSFFFFSEYISCVIPLYVHFGIGITVIISLCLNAGWNAFVSMQACLRFVFQGCLAENVTGSPYLAFPAVPESCAANGVA